MSDDEFYRRSQFEEDDRMSQTKRDQKFPKHLLEPASNEEDQYSGLLSPSSQLMRYSRAFSTEGGEVEISAAVLPAIPSSSDSHGSEGEASVHMLHVDQQKQEEQEQDAGVFRFEVNEQGQKVQKQLRRNTIALKPDMTAITPLKHEVLLSDAD